MNTYTLWYRPKAGAEQIRLRTYTERSYALGMAQATSKSLSGGVYLEENLGYDTSLGIIFCRECEL